MKCDVYVFVTLRPSSASKIDAVEHKGRFKWDIDGTTEEDALRMVMRQFTRKELARLQTITLDPISRPRLKWLETKKIFDFESSEAVK